MEFFLLGQFDNSVSYGRQPVWGVQSYHITEGKTIFFKKDMVSWNFI